MPTQEGQEVHPGRPNQTEVKPVKYETGPTIGDPRPQKQDPRKFVRDVLPSVQQFTEGLDIQDPNQRRAMAIRVAKAMLLELSYMGLISEGDAHDELKLAEEVHSAMGTPDEEKRPSLREVRDQAVDNLRKFQDKKSAEGLTEAERADEAREITRVYDKFSGPPLTTPPPPLEEYRGKVFLPPRPEAPLERQLPTDEERKFTAPDPLMRSAPVDKVPPTPALPGPTTNVPPPEAATPQDKKATAEADKEARKDKRSAEEQQPSYDDVMSGDFDKDLPKEKP